MPNNNHIHVRQMEVGDFDFVRELAAKQPTFTVPPPYVLWLFLRIKDAVCLVAEHNTEGPLAYILTVPIEASAKALHVWQLAVSDRGAHLHAAGALLDSLYVIVRRLRICTIAFSSVAGSAQYRAIRQAIGKFSVAKPESAGLVPGSVSRTETEYRVQLNAE